MTMLGAVATHVRRGDPALSIGITSVLFVMGLVVAIKRWSELKGNAVGVSTETVPA